MIERLKDLQAKKGQFVNGSDLSEACKSNQSFRSEIAILSKHYLHRSPNGCSNCYMDAYIELLNIDIEKAMSKEELKFKLRAGALLRDVVKGDISLNATNHNLTNELALYHLKTNPRYAELFEVLPDGWEKEAEEFVLESEESKKPKTTTTVEPKAATVKKPKTTTTVEPKVPETKTEGTEE